MQKRPLVIQYLLLLAIVALVLVFMNTRAVNIEQHNQRIALIERLRQVESEMDRSILMSTAFLLLEYDAFVEIDRRMRTTIDTLEAENQVLDPRGAYQFDTVLRRYREDLELKNRLLERIKSHAALVRNGLNYLPLIVNELTLSQPGWGEPLVPLLNKLLQYNLLPGALEEQEIRQAIKQLEARLPGEGEAQQTVENVMIHMRTVLTHISLMQSLRDRYLAVPTKDKLTDLQLAYNNHYSESSRLSNLVSYLLLMLAILLFAGLGYTMRRLALMRERSERSWKQLHDAVESLTEAFALYSRDGRLELCNSQYRAIYPWLGERLQPGISLAEVNQANRTHFASDSSNIELAMLPCTGRRSHVEELTDGRWLMASDSCTSAGELACVRIDITESKNHERELRKLYRALEQSPASVVITDTDGTIEYVNPKFEEITGFPAEEALGQNPRILKSGDKTSEEYKDLWDTIKSGKVWRGQFHNRHKDGAIYWEAASISPVRDDDDNITHFIAVKEDITAQKRAEDLLRMNATVFDTINEGILVTDPDNIVKTVNPAFTRITGYEPHEIIGRNPNLLSSGRHDETFYREIWSSLKQHGYWNGEIWNRRKDGSVFPEWLSLATITDDSGEVQEYVAVFSDITQRKQDEEKILYQANYDALTRLPNRSLLLDRLGESLKSAVREKSRLALLFVDLDRFKAVNDGFGHVAGDELLQQIAEMLTDSIREVDTVARFGGDEFVILLEGITRPDDVAEIAKKIINRMERPFRLTCGEVFVGASIGITMYPDDAANADSLLRNADLAMYRAKAVGKNNYQFFTEKINEQVKHRVDLELDLRKALEGDQFELMYQPIIDARLGRIKGAEALIRWHHPRHGMLSPMRFIPLAEDTGLIRPIGRWVMQTACEQAAAWQRQGEQLKISVNISTCQLRLGLDVEEIQEVLNGAGLEPSALNLEITESLFLEDTEQALSWMQALRDLGVTLSVDDFGTGYSSLGYLKRFPVNTLKIDREFVRDLPNDPADITLVQTILAMADSLGLEVVAEGVETEEQLDILLGAGCELIQGYLMGKPMPADQFAGYLKDFHYSSQRKGGFS